MTEHKTFLEYSRDFLRAKELAGKSKTTLRYYKQELGQFERWLKDNNLDNQDIKEFQKSQLCNYLFAIAQPHDNGNKKQLRKGLVSGRGKGGVHASYRAIRAVFNWIWYEEDFNIKNPIEKVKIDANRIPPLAEIPTDNIQALLNNCSHRRYELRDRAIIRTLFDSGLRATELCNLNVQDVNLTTGQVTIWHGKGNKFGISFIGQSSKNAIKEYLDTRDNVNPKEPLFPNQEGNRMTYSALRVLVNRLSKLSGVPNQGVHAFRRAFALTLWRETHDLLIVSRLLRHSNLQVTTRYLNINNEDLQSVHNQNSPADLLH